VSHCRGGFLGVADSVSRHGSISAAVATSGQCETSTNGESTTFAFLLGHKNLNPTAVLEIRAGKPLVGIDFCAPALGVLCEAPDKVVLILLTHVDSLPPCEIPVQDSPERLETAGWRVRYMEARWITGAEWKAEWGNNDVRFTVTAHWLEGVTQRR
jgi:hypothetical protein